MIRQAMVDWKRATESLLVTLDEQQEEKRSEVIERVEKLLDVRDQLQKKIESPFTKEEEAFGKEIIQLEQQFQTKMKQFFHTIQQDISVAQSKKTHMKSYVNPYRNLPQDGAYYDTKQ